MVKGGLRMYPNLNAEQKRRGLTNRQTAAAIRMKTSTFEYKKRAHRFLANECLRLCQLFHCSFDYLFETKEH